MVPKPKADTPAKFTFDRAFQKRIVRVLFQDPDFTATTAVHLQPGHFETAALRWFAQRIVSYAKKHGGGIGEDALRIEMSRDIKLGRLNRETIPKVELMLRTLNRPVKDKSFIKEEMFRFIKNQTTRQAIINSLDHLDVMDYDAIDTEFQKVLAVQESLGGGLGHFLMRDIEARTTRRASYVKNGVPTGLRLDDYLKPGGLPPKSLGCVVAPSGKGKSHVLVHMGRSAITEGDVPVLHVTLELSEEAVCDRYDAAFSQVPINRLEDERRKVRRRIKRLGVRHGEKLVVKEFPPASLTVPALRAYIRSLERTAFYPGLVIVDYADLMLPTHATRDANAYEDMGNIYNELRRLSYEVGAPVWTASQTQRQALNREVIDLDSISDSFKKAMVADVVLCLGQTPEEKKFKAARFFVAKNRLGIDKIEIKVRLDWSRSTIRTA